MKNWIHSLRYRLSLLLHFLLHYYLLMNQSILRHQPYLTSLHQKKNHKKEIRHNHQQKNNHQRNLHFSHQENSHRHHSLHLDLDNQNHHRRENPNTRLHIRPPVLLPWTSLILNKHNQQCSCNLQIHQEAYGERCR